jgi:hypothetical protein
MARVFVRQQAWLFLATGFKIGVSIDTGGELPKELAARPGLAVG